MNRLALACTLAVAAFAQNQKLTYEVATIKLNTSGDGRMMINGMGGGGGRFRVVNFPLRQLIVFAYADRTQGLPGPGSQGPNITGGPSWINTERYDVEARPEEGFVPNAEQSQKMLQALLEERFGLKVRRETKDGPIYVLVVAKNGLKAKKSTDQTPISLAGPPSPPPPPSPGAPGRSGGAPGGPPALPTTGPLPRGIMFVIPGQLRASAQTMTAFANMLSGQSGRKVIDKTGVDGLYDFELTFTPDQMPANLPPGVQFPTPDPNGPSLFTALQEQLGLKLEPSTGPLESIVIESVLKPTEN